MKKLILFVLVLATGPVAPLHAADPAAPPQSPDARYAFLESLVGGIWRAALPPGKDGVACAIELRFDWASNRQGVRFDSSIVKGLNREPYASGMYAWNGAKAKLQMFYTDSSRSLTQGFATQEGNVLVHDLAETNDDGTVDTVRVRLTKVGADAFTNEISILREGAYRKIAEVRYERHRGEPHQP